jgi:hypothetical protein
MRRSATTFASLPLAAALALLSGCQTPERFQLAGPATGGDLPGVGGTVAAGTGGMAEAGGGTWGAGGFVPSGGRGGDNAGGRDVGAGGGSSAGGRIGDGGAPGPSESGGAIGTAGRGGGGSGGGIASSGGMTGSGGGSAASGGMTASGGGGGRGGSPTPSGGATGTAGTTGRAGSSGVAGSPGAGGTAGGGGPCASVCANPTKVTGPKYNSGGVGLGAACFEITADIMGGTCFNFEARTLKLNGTTESCAGSNWPLPLPAKKNGGYCIEISAGSNASAGIQTF